MLTCAFFWFLIWMLCTYTGRESRLPLCIQGEGVGPKLQFSFDFLDMGNIVIGSKQSYKVQL